MLCITYDLIRRWFAFDANYSRVQVETSRLRSRPVCLSSSSEDRETGPKFKGPRVSFSRHRDRWFARDTERFVEILYSEPCKSARTTRTYFIEIDRRIRSRPFRGPHPGSRWTSYGTLLSSIEKENRNIPGADSACFARSRRANEQKRRGNSYGVRFSLPISRNEQRF